MGWKLSSRELVVCNSLYLLSSSMQVSRPNPTITWIHRTNTGPCSHVSSKSSKSAYWKKLWFAGDLCGCANAHAKVAPHEILCHQGLSMRMALRKKEFGLVVQENEKYMKAKIKYFGVSINIILHLVNIGTRFKEINKYTVGKKWNVILWIGTHKTQILISLFKIAFI